MYVIVTLSIYVQDCTPNNSSNRQTRDINVTVVTSVHPCSKPTRHGWKDSVAVSFLPCLVTFIHPYMQLFLFEKLLVIIELAVVLAKFVLAVLPWLFPSFVRALQSPQGLPRISTVLPTRSPCKRAIGSPQDSHVPPRISTVLPTRSLCKRAIGSPLRFPCPTKNIHCPSYPKLVQEGNRKSSGFPCPTKNIHRPSYPKPQEDDRKSFKIPMSHQEYPPFFLPQVPRGR